MKANVIFENKNGRVMADVTLLLTHHSKRALWHNVAQTIGSGAIVRRPVYLRKGKRVICLFGEFAPCHYKMFQYFGTGMTRDEAYMDAVESDMVQS